MKIKWTQVLYTLIIGFGMMISMSACTENENNGPINPGEDDELLEEGYFSFLSTLKSGSGAGLRAITESPGLSSEQKVSRVRIVLYDAATNKAEYAYDYSGTALHGSGQDFEGGSMLDPTDPDAPGSYAPSYTKFMPQAMLVKKKAYKLLVLLNPSDAVAALTTAAKEYVNIKPTDSPVTKTAKLIADFRDATGTAAGNDLTAFIGKANYDNVTPANNPDNFLMSNVQELVEVKETNFTQTAKEAYASPVIVRVDRAVAKVSLEIDYADVSNNSNAIVEANSGSWKLDITNKTGYWMRHMAPALKNATEGPLTDRENYYATDPNFDLYSHERYLYYGNPVPSGVITTSVADIKNYFNYITEANVTTALADKTPSFEYALENTMAKDEQFEDVTTAAILKIKYRPNETALKTALGTGGYFVWDNMVFTAANLEKIRDLTPADASDPMYIPFLTLQSYLKAQSAILEAPGTGFGADYGAPGTVSKTVGDITYNADDINYYRILIRHFTDDQETGTMAYGRYGLVRNNHYKLALNSIGAPGSIKIPDPKGPDDKEMYLGVSITVLPWVVRDQIVDID